MEGGIDQRPKEKKDEDNPLSNFLSLPQERKKRANQSKSELEWIMKVGRGGQRWMVLFGVWFMVVAYCG